MTDDRIPATAIPTPCPDVQVFRAHILVKYRNRNLCPLFLSLLSLIKAYSAGAASDHLRILASPSLLILAFLPLRIGISRINPRRELNFLTAWPTSCGGVARIGAGRQDNLGDGNRAAATVGLSGFGVPLGSCETDRAGTLFQRSNGQARDSGGNPAGAGTLSGIARRDRQRTPGRSTQRAVSGFGVGYGRAFEAIVRESGRADLLRLI